MMKKRIFSAMRPTGKLHLGHLVGALQNWVDLQDKYNCIFCIADWHGLMSEYAQAKALDEDIMDMAIDWIACGIDPKKSILFIQSSFSLLYFLPRNVLMISIEPDSGLLA